MDRQRYWMMGNGRLQLFYNFPNMEPFVRSIEDFLSAVQPQIAVLQSDPANRRGDPDPDTLAMLGDIPIFRTDQGGAIHLWTNGEQLWVEQAGQK